MAIVEMKKLSLVALKSDMGRILKALQALGNVEVVAVEEIEAQKTADASVAGAIAEDRTFGALEDEISQLQSALGFIKRYATRKKAFGYKHQLDARKMQRLLNERDKIMQAVSECRAMEEKLSEIRSRQTRINNMIAQMEPWKTMDIPIQDIKDTRETKVMMGTVDKDAAVAFEKTMMESFDESWVYKVGESKDECCYLLAFHKGIEALAGQVLKECDFNKVVFANTNGTPAEIIEDNRNILKAIEEQKQAIEARAKSFSIHADDMEMLYDSLSIRRDREGEVTKTLSTRNAFMLKGWAPSRQTEKIERKLRTITEAFRIDFEDVKDGEIFPVELDNPAFIRPFEIVTKLYSMPSHSGMDSNIFMAPFFFAFFGIMLGDAGYGLIMAVLATYFTVKLKLKGDGAKMGWLLALAGVSSLIWGALFGGWFGDAGLRIGITPLWFDPMRQPMNMLALCFGLGIVQLFTGMGLQAAMNIRRGRIWDAIFDQGLWYVFLIGLMLLATPLANIASYMAIGGAIALVLTQGRHQKSIPGKLIFGVLSLYNTSGFLSDVLSYSRLFALGLATGVIAMVVNQLGIMLGASWITFIFAIVILAGGHAFNIAISALGAYVHASRLQYIEFYGKFFEGGGHAFQPLSIKTKFTEILEEEAI